MAYLEQLAVRFDLDEELSTGEPTSELSRSEKVYPECAQALENIHIFSKLTCRTIDPKSILRVPHVVNFPLTDALRWKIAGYFKAVIGGHQNNIKEGIPKIMPSWGKVRIKDGGDSIRSACASGRLSMSERNSSYVRVCLKVFYYLTRV
jgi:hypothetical protein